MLTTSSTWLTKAGTEALLHYASAREARAPKPSLARGFYVFHTWTGTHGFEGRGPRV